MKRRLVKLVVFLLLGAIVNVAVAWGCALNLNAVSSTDGAINETYDDGAWRMCIVQFGQASRVYSSLTSFTSFSHDNRVSLPYAAIPSWVTRSASFGRLSFKPDREIVVAWGWPMLTTCYRIAEWLDKKIAWQSAHFDVLVLTGVEPDLSIATATKNTANRSPCRSSGPASRSTRCSMR